jgi:hypothetical protein
MRKRAASTSAESSPAKRQKTGGADVGAQSISKFFAPASTKEAKPASAFDSSKEVKAVADSANSAEAVPEDAGPAAADSKGDSKGSEPNAAALGLDLDSRTLKDRTMFFQAFDAIAKQLMQECELIVAGAAYKFMELEFYLVRSGLFVSAVGLT